MNNRKRNRCKQSRSIKFKPVELWNLDSTLSNIILSGLIQFKKSDRHGYPGRFNTLQQWNDTLDSMIWSFTEIKNEYKNSPVVKYSMKIYNENKASGDVGRTFIYPDDVLEEQKLYRNRLESGLHNFAEYFECLWD